MIKQSGNDSATAVTMAETRELLKTKLSAMKPWEISQNFGMSEALVRRIRPALTIESRRIPVDLVTTVNFVQNHLLKNIK